MAQQIPVRVFTVDSFTNEPFCGNPAAVCLLPWHVVCILFSTSLHTLNLHYSFPEEQLQPIAKEMNLSETGFIERLQADDDFACSRHFKLRWLTPTCEVNLCGHGTLAAAAVLFKELKNPAEEIVFSTLSGKLLARREGSKIQMDLPLNPPTPLESGAYSDIQELVLGGRFPVQEVLMSDTTKKLVLRLPDDTARESLESLPVPNHAKMLACHDGSRVRGVIVTVKSGSGEHDFLSRYFAPWNGIPEDPVTGSAHTVLAPYWAKELGLDRPLNARQVSPRGGNLVLRPVGDRIEVLGEACVVLRGELLLPTS